MTVMNLILAYTFFFIYLRYKIHFNEIFNEILFRGYCNFNFELIYKLLKAYKGSPQISLNLLFERMKTNFWENSDILQYLLILQIQLSFYSLQIKLKLLDSSFIIHFNLFLSESIKSIWINSTFSQLLSRTLPFKSFL